MINNPEPETNIVWYKDKKVWEIILLVAHVLVVIGVIIDLLRAFLNDDLNKTGITFAVFICLCLLVSLIFGFRNSFMFASRLDEKDKEILTLNEQFRRYLPMSMACAHERVKN